MDEKESDFRKKTLADALREEADEIERRAAEHPPEHRLTDGEKDEMLRGVMSRVREKEEAAGRTSGSRSGKKPFWNRAAKCACILLAAGGLIFATSLISEGNRMYWVQVWQNLFPGSNAARTNNDEDRLLSDVTEQEAREAVQEALHVPVPEFFYLPDGMEFENVWLDVDVKYARFQYIYSGENIFLSISGSETDQSEGLFPVVSGVETMSIDTPNGEISVNLIEDTTGKNGTVVYRAQWIYNNCYYELNGTLEKEELIKILEKMRYMM